MSKENIKICSACGTSNVNHNLMFLSSLFEETIGKIGEIFINLKKSQSIANFTEKKLHKILSILGITKYNNNIEKASSLRSKLIWEEAKKRGIKMEQVVIFGRHIEQYRAIINGKMFYFQSLPIPPWLSQDGYAWVDNKFKLFKKLSEAKIPIPKTKNIFTLKSLKENFKILQKPIILKPKNGSRGRHTTTNINTEKELEDAFYLTRKITPFMVAQEHLSGSVYRATVINYKLVGFFRADLPSVVGDGLKTIKDLITEKNNHKNEKISQILINDELINFIKRQGYNLKSIPEKNLIINLIAKTGRNYGGYTKEILGDIHPKMHIIFEYTSRLISAPVLGFDLIIEDPTIDPDTMKWGIIECNSLPFIDLHYFALEGNKINLAPRVWDLWSIPLDQ